MASQFLVVLILVWCNGEVWGQRYGLQGFEEFFTPGGDREYDKVDVQVEQTWDKYHSEYRSVKAKQCGGNGKLKKLYVEDCDPDDDPCELEADDKERVFELVFIPSDDIDKVGHILETHIGKNFEFVTLYDKKIKSSIKDEKTTIIRNHSTKMNSAWKGQTFTLRYSIYEADEDRRVEMCVQAKFKMV